jgi:FYVE/RhoGEF/PH domain-containing protein 5/6
MVRQLLTLPMKDLLSQGRLIFPNPDVPKIFDLLHQVEMVSKTLNDELGGCLAGLQARPVVHALQTFPRLVIIYFDYIRAYHSTMPLLAACRQSNKAIDTFFNRQEELLGAAVENYLITPVQRPPRYRLLFQDLLKSTPPDSPDYAVLQKSVAKINEEVGKLDQAIDELREANWMAELSLRLVDFPVFVHQRRLFFQGEALKFSRKWTNNRFLILFSDVLVVAEPAVLDKLKVNKLYKSGEYLITDVSDRPPFINAIDIRQKTKSFRLNMKGPDEKQQFLAAFAKMTRLRGISQIDLEKRGFAPVWIPDDQAPTCMSCNAKFSFTNRRHHCRSCGDCICKTCWQQKIAIPGLDDTPQAVCNQCFCRIVYIQQKEREGTTSGDQQPTDDE